MERAPITRHRSKWRPIDAPGLAGLEGLDAFERNVSDGRLVALVALEPAGLHLSVSFRDHRDRLSRYPTWDELADARDALLPADAGFVMHLPAAGEYVALHDTTFHLHQFPPAE